MCAPDPAVTQQSNVRNQSCCPLAGDGESSWLCGMNNKAEGYAQANGKLLEALHTESAGLVCRVERSDLTPGRTVQRLVSSCGLQLLKPDERLSLTESANCNDPWQRIGAWLDLPLFPLVNRECRCTDQQAVVFGGEAELLPV